MVIRAVEIAVWQRQGKADVILHSDRGSQFTSGDYQRFFEEQHADVFDECRQPLRRQCCLRRLLQCT